MRYPIIVSYARLHEPQWMIDDLRTNTRWADAHVEIDNRRQHSDRWQHEGRTNADRRAAVERKARVMAGEPMAWHVHLDPDERLQDSAGDILRAAMSDAERTVRGTGRAFGFPLREMWTPTQYRTDGSWLTKKPRRRAYLLQPGQDFVNKPIHCGVSPIVGVTDRVTLDAWLYHLKNIEPANRIKRADAYYAADPQFRHQRPESRSKGRAGWNWLHDETGLTLSPIPAGREFSPPYDRAYQFVRPGE